MSAQPQHTQILIKDLDFQAKYHLSHTQTDVMAYMVNVPYWADKVEGYFVIATSKILSDMPHLGLKNFEPAFKILKMLGLIESKIVEVSHWRGKPKLRGIRLTEKGKKYQSNMILPSQEAKVKKLEKENKKLKEMLEALTIDSEPMKEESEAIAKPQMPKKEEIDSFIQTVTKRFGANSKPICNFVPTYQKETTFYINSYRKLSTIAPNGESKQISNPQMVYEFWQWLFIHSQRIGDKIDFSKIPTVKELKQRYLNQTITFQDKSYMIYDFVKENNGVTLQINDKNNRIGFIKDIENQKNRVFELKECERLIWELMKS